MFWQGLVAGAAGTFGVLFVAGWWEFARAVRRRRAGAALAVDAAGVTAQPPETAVSGPAGQVATMPEPRRANKKPRPRRRVRRVLAGERWTVWAAFVELPCGLYWPILVEERVGADATTVAIAAIDAAAREGLTAVGVKVPVESGADPGE